MIISVLKLNMKATFQFSIRSLHVFTTPSSTMVGNKITVMRSAAIATKGNKHTNVIPYHLLWPVSCSLRDIRPQKMTAITIDVAVITIQADSRIGNVGITIDKSPTPIRVKKFKTKKLMTKANVLHQNSLLLALPEKFHLFFHPNAKECIILFISIF